MQQNIPNIGDIRMIIIYVLPVQIINYTIITINYTKMSQTSPHVSEYLNNMSTKGWNTFKSQTMKWHVPKI